MIQIAIVEDISRIAETLKEKIHLSSDFRVKYCAPNGEAIIRFLEKDHNVDVYFTKTITLPSTSTSLKPKASLIYAIEAGV